MIITYLVRCLRLKLSGVVGVLATGIAAVQYFIVDGLLVKKIKSHAPVLDTYGVTASLHVLGWHAVVVGYVVSLASSSVLHSRTTWLLGKQESGQLDPLRLCLGFPYQVGIQTKLYLERKYGHENQYDVIVDEPGVKVFLGSWPAHAGLLPACRDSSKGKIAVLDVTCELPCKVRDSCDAYHLVPVWDTHSPSVSAIQHAVEWAVEFLQPASEGDERMLYVHCAHGHGRSATVLGALLIATGRADNVSDAVKLMKKGRPRVRLNTRQQLGLQGWFSDYYNPK